MKPDFFDNNTLEKYSSAVSMSDMELFVFPELLFPAVIANILSPIIWRWREDPWFTNIHKKSFTYKVNRIKQYIMEHYVFNLDLDTWGLTSKEREIGRFKDFVDMDLIKQSNALFGYEGDKYYFDIDIRRHFGLEKYSSEIIPYWKTETVEAMTAFRHKEPFKTGAGECVSFSVLYAAALFIVGRIPLENIFLIGTPLHSQNFIAFNDGLLTNNRRIVTKAMWFNGSLLSTRARRALENEKVSIVSHISGYIHSIYEEATINEDLYRQFTESLQKFLTTEPTPLVFTSFLRYHMNFKKCFQYRHSLNGRDHYIALETIFEYEHATKHIFAEGTREALLREIDDEEFSPTPLENRIIIQDVEDYLTKNMNVHFTELREFLIKNAKKSSCNDKESINLLLEGFSRFLHIEPKLPHENKNFKQVPGIQITIEQSREEILALIEGAAVDSELALLSLHAFRKMDIIDWRPFIKSALERNPVSIEGLKGKTADDAYKSISEIVNESIYDAKRLAQPDEVWNFGRGDGIEKAILMANFLRNVMKVQHLELIVKSSYVKLIAGSSSYAFLSTKDLIKHLDLD